MNAGPISKRIFPYTRLASDVKNMNFPSSYTGCVKLRKLLPVRFQISSSSSTCMSPDVSRCKNYLIFEGHVINVYFLQFIAGLILSPS